MPDPWIKSLAQRIYYAGRQDAEIWKAKTNEENKQVLPGTVTEVTKKEIYVQTGNGQLILEEIQLEGKKRMTAEAFLRGKAILEGTVFGMDKKEKDV